MTANPSLKRSANVRPHPHACSHTQTSVGPNGFLTRSRPFLPLGQNAWSADEVRSAPTPSLVINSDPGLPCLTTLC